MLRSYGIVPPAPPDSARKPILGKRTYDDTEEENNADGLGDEEELDIENDLKALRVGLLYISRGCNDPAPF